MNPSSRRFTGLRPDDEVSFVPLEAVWPDERFDVSEVRLKEDVATGYTRFEEGDVLVPKITPTFQAGRSAIARGLLGGVGAGTTELHVLRPRPGVLSEYLWLLVRSPHFLAEGESALEGVAGQKRVSEQFLSDYRVPELTTQEQERLVARVMADLREMAAIESVLRRTANLLAERFVASVQRLFDNFDRRCRLKDLLRASISYGVLVPVFTDDGVPFIRVNDLSALDERFPALARIPPDLSRQYDRTVTTEGDLLVSVVGTLGRSAVIRRGTSGANIARAVARIRTHTVTQAELLHYWFKTPQFGNQALLATGSDTAQPTLNVGDLATFDLRWPNDGSAATAAVRHAQELEREWLAAAGAVQRQLSLLAERRRVLFAEAVSGNLDLGSAA